MNILNKILNFTLFIILGIQPFVIFSQSPDDEATPLTPSISKYKSKVGIHGGVIIPISPEELYRVPRIYDKSSESLMNGLNGLGYKETYNIGFDATFNFYRNFWTGINFSYSSWLSKNSCKYNSNPVVNSENFLSFFNFGINGYYYLIKFIYTGIGLDINIFSVNVKEDNSKRQIIDFKNKYSRLGLSLIFGVDIPIFKRISFDVSAKAQITNLIGRQDDNPETGRSEAIINSYSNRMESHIILLQLNFGILFLTK